jgi:hypothetical protein
MSDQPSERRAEVRKGLPLEFGDGLIDGVRGRCAFGHKGEARIRKWMPKGRRGSLVARGQIPSWRKKN